MIKRILAVIAALLLITPITAHADMVWGNEFHAENEDNTIPVAANHKIFIVNAPDGHIIPKEEPGSSKGIPTKIGYRSGWGYDDIDDPKHIVFVFKNGELISIEGVYLHNGEYWGIMSPSHMYQPPGWVKMDELLMTYTGEDFEREFADEFYEYTGDFAAVLAANRIVKWQWPGADRETSVITGFRGEDSAWDIDIEDFTDIVYAYKDEDGREWGRLGSFFLRWICIDFPEDDTLPSFNPAPEPVKWSHEGQYSFPYLIELFSVISSKSQQGDRDCPVVTVKRGEVFVHANYTARASFYIRDFVQQSESGDVCFFRVGVFLDFDRVENAAVFN